MRRRISIKKSSDDPGSFSSYGFLLCTVYTGTHSASYIMCPSRFRQWLPGLPRPPGGRRRPLRPRRMRRCQRRLSPHPGSPRPRCSNAVREGGDQWQKLGQNWVCITFNLISPGPSNNLHTSNYFYQCIPLQKFNKSFLFLSYLTECQTAFSLMSCRACIRAPRVSSVISEPYFAAAAATSRASSDEKAYWPNEAARAWRVDSWAWNEY